MNVNEELKRHGYDKHWRKKVGKVWLSSEYVASWGSQAAFWRVVASMRASRDEEIWNDASCKTLKDAEKSALAKLLRGCERESERHLRYAEQVSEAIEASKEGLK